MDCTAIVTERLARIWERSHSRPYGYSVTAKGPTYFQGRSINNYYVLRDWGELVATKLSKRGWPAVNAAKVNFEDLRFVELYVTFIRWLDTRTAYLAGAITKRTDWNTGAQSYSLESFFVLRKAGTFWRITTRTLGPKDTEQASVAALHSLYATLSEWPKSPVFASLLRTKPYSQNTISISSPASGYILPGDDPSQGTLQALWRRGDHVKPLSEFQESMDRYLWIQVGPITAIDAHSAVAEASYTTSDPDTGTDITGHMWPYKTTLLLKKTKNGWSVKRIDDWNAMIAE